MKTISCIIVLFFCLTCNQSIRTEKHLADLESGFKNPPNQAKARTWWHWISGNVSKSGITKDLEAMKAVGIQEAQLFNVHLGFPQGPIKYLSEEWLDLFKFSAEEAQRLDLELAFHNSAGWSSSGGPWVTEEHAMQTVVFSELTVEGGKTITKKLPRPETKFDYYKDIAVLAFPKPKATQKIEGLDYKMLSERVRNHLLPDRKGISNEAIILKENIKSKHKFALKDFAVGDEIFMYGVLVGKAVLPIEKGEAITTENIKHDSADFNDSNEKFVWTAPDTSNFE